MFKKMEEIKQKLTERKFTLSNAEGNITVGVNEGNFSPVDEISIVDPYGFIYITTNIINGKKYIGQRKFSHGWKGYLGSGIILTQAIKKYDKNNFRREIIAIAYSKEELNKLEIEFIYNHNAVNNDDYYNITYGGDSPMSGRKMSEEHKEKISKSEKGKEVSKETREKISASSIGKTHSDETKEKIRKTSKGRLHSDETKEKMSGENNHFYGKHHSEESKLKMSNSLKGRKHSEETKNKMKIISIKRGRKPNARKIICITTGEIFDCIKDASEKYNIQSAHIVECCKGVLKSSGRLPDRTKLVWMYL